MVNIVAVLKTLINKLTSLNSTRLSKGTFIQIFSQEVDFTGAVTAGSNKWNINSAKIIWVGHMLRVSLRATRTTATAAGDISNETVVKIRINHGGIIKNVFTTTTRNYDGTLASYQTGITKIDDNTVDLSIKLCATHSALKEVYIMDNVPVSIDISKFY
jgi:hypothetical protein